jgi:predicted GH43/DUF377 family glycosyl hydrolase
MEKGLVFKKHPELIFEPTNRQGDFDSQEIDSPKVVKFGNSFYMFYVGWDGEKNRIGLAKSQDLIKWERCGLVLDTGEKGTWDSGSVAGPYPFIENNQIYLFYCGFSRKGYERGKGCIGMAKGSGIEQFSRISQSPVLYPGKKNSGWSTVCLYQSFVIKSGEHYFMFFNGKSRYQWPWSEDIGLATSKDLKNWMPHSHNPVLVHGQGGEWTSPIIGDPWIIRRSGCWEMYFFALDGQKDLASVVLATSKDLYSWDMSLNPLVTPGPAGTFDEKYAHKPSLLKKDGNYYMFYSAVNRQGHRAIAMASSKSKN